MSIQSFADPVLHRRAKAVLLRLAKSGSESYDRGRMLPRLVPLGLGGLPTPEPERSRAILRLLARALRAERALGRAGHWTYDLNRHIGLMQAFKAERERSRRPAAGRR